MYRLYIYLPCQPRKKREEKRREKKERKEGQEDERETTNITNKKQRKGLLPTNFSSFSTTSPSRQWLLVTPLPIKLPLVGHHYFYKCLPLFLEVAITGCARVLAVSPLYINWQVSPHVFFFTLHFIYISTLHAFVFTVQVNYNSLKH